MVRRSTPVSAILTLVLLAGCGENKPAKPPAPPYQAPADQPADQSLTDDQRRSEPVKPSPSGEPLEAGQTEPTVKEEAAASESATTKPEEMPEEKETTREGAPESDAPAATDNDADNRPDSTTNAEETAPTKRAGSSSRLLRGLGGSFSRAIAKTASGANSEDEARPAPDLADDPFPKGEPVENNKSKE